MSVRSHTVTVVVAAYQVAAYLQPCLDSIARQTVDDIQVIIVDDGSTDSTGQIADRYAAAHRGWITLHTPNHGLSEARNLGATAATGRYLLFVDGDDILPHRALERLLGSAHRTGSWVVSGGVLRWDGRRVSASELHHLALHTAIPGAHLRRDHQLVYDTTAWNKLVLRDYWHDQGLRYPPGQLFEDLATSFATHLHTNATDVITEPVYIWRIRTGAEPSITQRLGEQQALEHRMAALADVDALAATDPALRDAHDAKALDIDLRRIVGFLPTAGDTYRERFLDLAGRYLNHVRDHVVTGRDPLRRLVVAAIRERRLDLLDAIAIARSGARPPGPATQALASDLIVQRELRERGLLRGHRWLRSSLNRTAYRLLPASLRTGAADRRYGRADADVTDIVAI